MADQATILVVDDEKVLRDGCTLILKPEGYRVTTAANGQEALDQLAAGSGQRGPLRPDDAGDGGPGGPGADLRPLP